MRTRLALAFVALLATPLPLRANENSAPTDDVRKQLVAARDTAWRAFFQPDPEMLDDLLGKELIAIQQSEEPWSDREHLLAMARAMAKQHVRLVRLEFPHTEIQIFGDTAILYYTWLMES